MIKKIMLMLLLFSTLLISGFSATEYLNSCGKTSGWLSNTEYIINFDTIESDYINSYCFKIPYGTYNNMSITQNVEKLIINKTGFSFFYYEDLSAYKNVRTATLNDFYVHNLNIELLEGSLYMFRIRLQNDADTRTTYNYNSPVFENITLSAKGGYLFHYSSINSLNTNGLSNAVFNNINLNNMGFLSHYTMRYSTMNYENILITNSIINYPISRGLYGTHLYDSLLGTRISNLTLKNTSIIGRDFLPSFTGGKLVSVNFENYFNTFDSLTDSDNNNIADEVGIYFDQESTKPYTPVMSFETNDYNIFYSVKEAQGVFNLYSSNDKLNVFTQSETIPSSTPFVSLNENGQPSEFLGEYNIIDSLFSVFGKSGIDCGVVFDNKCYFQDSPSFSQTSTNDYKGLISVYSDSVFNNMEFKKISDQNNGHILANDVDLYLNNISITNNDLFKADSKNSGGNNYMIKLKANNILIKDNVFMTDNTLTNTTEYEYIFVNSLNDASNVITENKFLFNTTNILSESQVFNQLADSKFYNNYIGSQVVVSNTPIIDFEINPLVSYIYNGNIYYFHVGNYYEDFLGCVDADSDGFCDSSFTTGAFTDNYALSEYPFDFYSHLGDAEVVSSLDFDIALENIIDNETIEVTDLETSQIIFQFNHNSDMPDLNCDLVLDAVSVTTISNPVKDTIINFSGVTDWDEKPYTLRVECSNSEAYETSEEIIFNIVQVVGDVYGCTDSNANNYNVLATIDDGSCTYDAGQEPSNNETTGFNFDNGNIISDDIGDTSDNIVGFVGSMTNSLSNIALSIGGFMFAIFIVLGVIAIFR